MRYSVAFVPPTPAPLNRLGEQADLLAYFLTAASESALSEITRVGMRSA